MDDLSSTAKFIVKYLVEGAEEFARTVDDLHKKTGSASKTAEKLSEHLHNLNDELQKTAKSAGQSGDATRDVGKEWTDLDKRVKQATDAYREFRREVALGISEDMSPSQWLAAGKGTRGLTAADLEAYRQGNKGSLLGDESAEKQAAAQRRAAAEAENWAKAERQLNIAVRDGIDARRAQRDAINAQRLAEQRLNAERAKTTNTFRPGSFLAQSDLYGGGSATRAADTTFAQQMVAQEAASVRARNGLAEYDAQLNRNTVSYKASTSALAQQLIKQEEMANSLPRLRYALYDVATTATVAAVALGAVVGGAAVASASFESSFTGVERTARLSGASVGIIRDELAHLTREIPAAFGDVSTVATLGAQLDIAASDLENFSGQVIQFSATAGTTNEQTAQGFGRIGQLLDVSADKYANLGSAILYAGNTSVATEQDVLDYSQRLAIAGNEAGLTADQVIALSSTLASLGIGLEASQGATQRIFQDIRRAVDENGEALANYASVAGTTAAEFAAAWSEEPQQAFSSLIEGLSKAQSLTQTLDGLGFVETREVRLLTALANNTEFYNEQLSTTAQAYQDGTYLADSYAKVVDDLASRWQILLNAIAEFGAAAGDALAPFLKDAITNLANLINWFTDLISTQAGQWFVGITLAAGGAAAALLAVVAATALAVGSYAALRGAIVSLGWAEATSGFKGFASAAVGASTAVGSTATALRVFRVALASTGIGLAVVALGTLATAFSQASASASSAFSTYVGTSAGLSDALTSDAAARAEAFMQGNLDMLGSFVEVSLAADDNTDHLDDNRAAIENTAKVLGIVPTAYDGVNGAIADNTAYLGENTLAWLKNQLIQSEAFQELVGNADFVAAWEAIGADFDQVVKLQAAGGEEAVWGYFLRLSQAAVDGGNATIDQIRALQPALANALGGLAGGGSAIPGLVASSGGNNGALGKLILAGAGATNQIRLLGLTGQKAGKQVADGLDEGTDSATDFNEALGGGGGGGGTVERIRTLVDWANDLSSVMKRAFDIRFGGQQGLDTIASGWSKIQKATESSAKAIRDLHNDIADLTADRSMKEFWLTVAEGYGDTLRAGKLSAELGELDAKLADANSKLADEQAKSSKTLVGNSDAAIENRSALLGLVGNYQDYLAALASSGASQADVEATARQLKAEFIQQATQMGYNRDEVDKYAVAFDGMTLAIQRVPRDITVDANTDPALQALAEFEARARQSGAAAGGGFSRAFEEAAGEPVVQVKYRLPSYAELMRMQQTIRDQTGDQNFRIALGPGGQGGQVFGYSSGGYVGDGGKYEPKGIVHGGEFVFSKAATKAIGVRNLAYAHQMAKSGRAPVAAGGGSSFDPAMLLPIYDMLGQVRDAVGITLPGAAVQSLVGAQNASTSRRRVR
ncbi:phage tail tape measure protein [Agromyces larvae]|uniref:Phage tail tape measure protein n=1 Tax=Agromyces larvae TaxID=2929802 RepID=A0ABY4C347_9MICO|nr:phage tail tape measure protein [Agromyces larvae]UOE45890.1 phage tail tape measure protein [Agromyces larvae]